MTGLSDSDFGYFPTHADVGELLFHHAFKFMAEFAYRIFRRSVIPCRGRKAERVIFVE
jgi:hypothetical protein